MARDSENYRGNKYHSEQRDKDELSSSTDVKQTVYHDMPKGQVSV